MKRQFSSNFPYISIRGHSCLFSPQDVKAEALHGKDTGESHLMLSQQLPEFAKLGEFSFEKFGCYIDEKNSEKLQGELLQTFTEHKTVYHESCVSEYNAQKLQRAMKRNPKLLDTSLTELSSSSIETVARKRVRRSDSIEKLSLGKSKCLFCRILDKLSNLCPAGTLHAQSDKVHTFHVSQFTETLRIKALKLYETQVLTAISTGDVTANEIIITKNV